MPKSNERNEREYQLDIGQAVANTESEIFGDALDEKELDLDGDTSLEEMGEGLEGEDLNEEDEAEEQTEENGDEETEADDKAGDKEVEGEEETQRDERGRFEDRQQHAVPSGRLREEAAARRAAEERSALLERQLAEINGRMTELSARVNAPSQTKVEKTEKPDVFADPEGFARWMEEEAVRKAEAKIEQRFQAFHQQQQQVAEQRVNRSFEQAARGERGFEFTPAYQALIGGDPRDTERRALVQRIFDAPDPAKEMFDWWDANGGPEYREQVLERLMPRQQNGSRERQQPRHETRLPNSLRHDPPSLNSARGGQRQQVQDPEMMDDTDESVFRFATRRA